MYDRNWDCLRFGRTLVREENGRYVQQPKDEYDIRKAVSFHDITVDETTEELVTDSFDSFVDLFLNISGKFMFCYERMIIGLVFEMKKTPSEIAKILGFRFREQAYYEIKKIIRVAAYYARFGHVIATIDRMGPMGAGVIDKLDLRILKLYLIERRTISDIAKIIGRSVNMVSYRVRKRIRDSFEKNGWHSHVAMIDEYISSGNIFLSGRKRLVMNKASWREEVVKYLVDRAGEIFYVWGGQDIEHNVADCSGLVIEVLKKFSVLPEKFPDRTAYGLSKDFVRTENPEVGDLVFYGKSWKHVSHVMFYTGEVKFIGKNSVAGMCGGRRGMTVEQARLRGAALWFKSSPRYRRDFLGYGKVV
jgi:cell wall-associated NlpC family hydrolase